MYQVDYQFYQFLCTALVFCVIVYVSMLYTIVLSTRAMLNVLGKCDVLGEAMQPFVHHHHDGVAKISYRGIFMPKMGMEEKF